MPQINIHVSANHSRGEDGKRLTVSQKFVYRITDLPTSSFHNTKPNCKRQKYIFLDL